MIGMFETIGSVRTKRAYALSDIEKIGPQEKGPGDSDFFRLTLRDNGEIRICPFEAAELMERPVQIMPAEPGTQIVCVGPNGEHWFKPMIGWALCFDGSLRPLTPVGVDRTWIEGVETYETSYIQMPSGVVMANADGEGVFDTLEELLEEVKTQRQHRAGPQPAGAPA